MVAIIYKAVLIVKLFIYAYFELLVLLLHRIARSTPKGLEKIK